MHALADASSWLGQAHACKLNDLAGAFFNVFCMDAQAVGMHSKGQYGGVELINADLFSRPTRLHATGMCAAFVSTLESMWPYRIFREPMWRELHLKKNK